jgi:hypothetical protein
VHAGNVQDATRKWIDRLFGTVPGLSWEDHEELLDDLEDELQREDLTTPIEGCRGVWRIGLVDAQDEVLMPVGGAEKGASVKR